MQGEAIESALSDSEDRIIGSDGRAATDLKAAIDARWEQAGPD